VTPQRQRNPTRAPTAVTKSATSTTHRSGCSIATPPPPHTATAGKSRRYATDLLRRGVAAEVVQHLLGHASITTTVDTYSHLGMEDARRALVAAGVLAEVTS
jgi:integrase